MTNRRRVIAVLAAMLVASQLSLSGSATSAQTSLDQDLTLMLSWFTGEFDNNQQVFIEKETKTPAAEVHEHIHSIFSRVALPAVGSHVFYVQQYLDNDPAKIYRQRLYSFSPDPAAKAIVLRIYSFPDDKAVLNAHLDASKLAGVTLPSLRALPGCEVFWTKTGNEFTGAMKAGACRVASRTSGQFITIMDDLKLTPSEIWISDRATNDAGERVFGHPKGVPHKLTRSRNYQCYTTIRKAGAAETGTSPDDYHIFRNMKMHDQGQIIPLVPKDAPQQYSIELAELTYASSKTRVLKLAVYETGKDRAISYSWSAPGAERIGINLRTVEVGCTLQP